jgi:hypothetical protein
MKNNDTLLFEQLVRINQLMGDNKDKYIINEQLWKSIVSVIDNLSSTSKFSDNAVMDAAKAIRKASKESDKIAKIAKFLNVLENSALDATKLDDVLDNILKNLDSESSANLNTLDNAFKKNVQNQGKLTDDMMKTYENSLKTSIETPPQLSVLKNKIIAKKVSDMKEVFNRIGYDELAARGSVGNIRNIDFQIDAFNSIGRTKVPPIKFDKASVNKINNLVDNIEQMYLKGEYSLEQLSKFLSDNQEIVKSIDEVIAKNANTLENITGTASGTLGKSFEKLKKGFINTFDPKILKPLLVAMVLGVVGIGGYAVGSMDQVALWGKGKAKEEIGMEDANCLSSVKGFAKLSSDEIRKLGEIRINGKFLGCENTKNDADPSIKLILINVIKPTEGDKRTGFSLEFEDGHRVTAYPGGTTGTGGVGKTKTQSDGVAFVNSLNGSGEDLEGLTLKVWEPLGNELYRLTLSNDQIYNLKWDGTNFIAQ